MLDVDIVARALDEQGWARVPGLLPAPACAAVAALYDDGDAPGRFRRTIDMARHGYGSGEYRYFAYPLPAPIADLRRRCYEPLAQIANQWQDKLGVEARFPPTHEAWLARCHEAGQTRPTPLLLRYGAGDYNRLHQDLYGPLVFPLQLTVLLSRPGVDFIGGEIVITEQRPRLQARAHVVPLDQGDAVVFAVHHRPAAGKRGFHRVNVRHGVSRIASGHRQTLGIIFHDAA